MNNILPTFALVPINDILFYALYLSKIQQKFRIRVTM